MPIPRFAIVILLGVLCLHGFNLSAEPPDTRDAAAADHWSFQRIQEPSVPSAGTSDWPRNPIDNFVLRKLIAEDIKPSPEAEKETLIRRIYLDLLGLPPSPAQVDAFLSDSTPYAYRKLVNRVLASPHYGERWGRHWLDLARYADSDGFEKDTVRPHAWRYRQWVIDALNRDLPYDQFVSDQLAGDLLENPSLESQVATGFHRNTLTNREGGVDPEEFRVEQVVDRTNTTAQVFMGLTLACAQCHDHKYDPFEQSEYYGLYAFFNSSTEKDIPAPLDAEAVLYERDLRAWEGRRADIQQRIRKYSPGLEEKLPEWEAAQAEGLAKFEWTLLEPASISSAGGATFETLDDGSTLVGGNSPLVDTYTVVVTTDLQNITGFRIEVLTEPNLPNTGPGRAHHGNFILTEFDVHASPLNNPNGKAEVEISKGWTDFWEKGWSIDKALDGDPTTGWSINAWQGYNENRRAVFHAKEDVGYSTGTTLTFTLDHQFGTSHSIGRFKIYAATGDREFLEVDPSVPEILAKSTEARSNGEKQKLLSYFGKFDPDMRELTAELKAHDRAKPKSDQTRAQTIAENPVPPQTHVHIRGDFLRKGEEVSPHTPAILPRLNARNGQPDRLDLARWLTTPEHPLTARVAVNRIWEHLFGQGIVVTSEDFGTRGEAPSHPELLDWLASEYMARGWSTKEMITLMVSSATYRQSSHIRTELIDRDPNNKLLARQNRFRVEAEIVRDLFLAASGLLNPTVGGPSVRPQLPAGIADLGYAGSIKWNTSRGDNAYRRGLYIHFQRTVPYPMLMTFDCPDSNVTVIRRTRSNSPLQALTLLNDPVFYECAQALGNSACTTASDDLDESLRQLFRVCLARTPEDRELEQLRALWNDQKALFDGDLKAAEATAGKQRAEDTPPADAAAWVMVARTTMNLDEFLTRE